MSTSNAELFSVCAGSWNPASRNSTPAISASATQTQVLLISSSLLELDTSFAIGVDVHGPGHTLRRVPASRRVRSLSLSAQFPAARRRSAPERWPVSYTHLTLPT